MFLRYKILSDVITLSVYFTTRFFFNSFRGPVWPVITLFVSDFVVSSCSAVSLCFFMKENSDRPRTCRLPNVDILDLSFGHQNPEKTLTWGLQGWLSELKDAPFTSHASSFPSAVPLQYLNRNWFANAGAAAATPLLRHLQRNICFYKKTWLSLWG